MTMLISENRKPYLLEITKIRNVILVTIGISSLRQHYRLIFHSNRVAFKHVNCCIGVI